jgi:hypothetical protein
LALSINRARLASWLWTIAAAAVAVALCLAGCSEQTPAAGPGVGGGTGHGGAGSTTFGRGAADVWAGGDSVAHFDGQSWSLVGDAPAPAYSGADEHNTLVSGDAGSVWLVTPGPRFFRKVTGP